MIKKIVIMVVFLGVVAFTLNYAFGKGLIPFIEEQGIGIGHTTLAYKYDVWGYLNNIKNTWTDIDTLQLIMPTKEWKATDNITDIGNNLCVMINVIITGLNILIYPLRLGFYAISIVMSLLGIQTTNPEESGLKWLIDLSNYMKSWQIPYID